MLASIMNLPDALQHHLAHSELSITAWSADDDELSVRVDKTSIDETGRLAFRGILHVNLPPTLTVDCMEIHTAATAPDDLWGPDAPARAELGDSDFVVLLFGSFGGRSFVVAEELSYEILQ